MHNLIQTLVTCFNTCHFCFFQNFTAGDNCKFVVEQVNQNRDSLGLLSLLGLPSLQIPQLNESFCDSLADFLSNNSTASYDWKDALENVNNLANMTRTYARVSVVILSVCLALTGGQRGVGRGRR